MTESVAGIADERVNRPGLLRGFCHRSESSHNNEALFAQTSAAVRCQRGGGKVTGLTLLFYTNFKCYF